jgi:delta-aminolevulinic acid dehydratase/porphobilinogen synthase
LIYPLFVCPGESVRNPVSSMPEVFNLSVDEALRDAEEAASLGLGGLILFGIPERRTTRVVPPGMTMESCSEPGVLSNNRPHRRTLSSSPKFA